MKRYHHELERTQPVHRVPLRGLHKWPLAPVDCVREFQAGRFRKQKAIGGGRARCLICHYEKICGMVSVKDRVREQRFHDWLNDYYHGGD